MAEITLHLLPPSHPCMAVEVALRFKGLEYERVALTPGPHVEEMQRIYGEGRWTVPGMLCDGEAVHGSRQILERLEQLAPEPSLFGGDAAAVREAERWGDEEFQDLGRRLPWGTLHFRPEAMGTFGGGDSLDGPGTDFAIGFIRASWKYHKISAAKLEQDLAGLPAKLDHIDELATQGTIGGEQLNAADLQIGSTVRVLLTLDDLKPLIEGRPCAEIAMRHFPQYTGHVPAGALPVGWVPARASS